MNPATTPNKHHFVPTEMGRNPLYGLLTSLIVPRAIAWVSSVSADGTFNLAPHSFCTVACVEPPILVFCSIGDKDTVKNIRETNGFVFNIGDHALANRLNVSSAPAPRDVDEFELTGLTPVAATRVSAPLVGEAPAAIECSLHNILELGGGTSFAIFGEVQMVHVSERVLDYRNNADPSKLDAIARMGDNWYATIRDRFEMVRPRAWPVEPDIYAASRAEAKHES